MMEVVTGGSGSGKSAYAEQKICGLQQGTGRLYYIATMYPYGSETERKIEKHRWMRAGKGFRTLEWYTGLSECIEKEFSGQEGPSRTRNAIALLKVLNYPKSIVEQAQKESLLFDEQRQWYPFD